ncbi:MAG: hypothetical protein PHV98_00815 [Candidatus Omnitrophica bacterium]|nr:hypothetical protein [Candidatus Omnitrophota bacterium]
MDETIRIARSGAGVVSVVREGNDEKHVLNISDSIEANLLYELLQEAKEQTHLLQRIINLQERTFWSGGRQEKYGDRK